ncbi:transporter substrate-binding domain-containing protein [Psychromarinibacter sp. C21-152]|uniref:Transporter substrate-binding domain-containing protein n=1 Tax=Psychromarinibacter sediminicola TaxID=3033385 RepID=A0AAE3TAY0_9RHOB|nr:transporter substrate-binding domain-containing protein [Psychromarinibacter sediminicola]MDF0603308.1 transporter substrate-binding domain-containing protein [Psychromarinibacter sediminicola]
MMKYLTAIASAALVSIGISAPAKADLKDILDAGTVRIGVPSDVPPFGFLDENNEQIGLDVEVAKMIAEGLGVELELTTVTSANRISYLATNRIDLTIAAMGATPQRALQIDFSSPYSALSIGLFGPEDSGLESLSDLGDQSIGVARGTTQDIELTERMPDANIQRYDDDATAASAYLSGQVELFATANIIANDLSKRDPDNALAPIEIFRYSPTHVGVPKGNPELLRWVDTFVFYNLNNGRLSDLTEEWLGQRLPESFPSM